MRTSTISSSGSLQTDSRVVDGLNLVLADSYALMALTHFAHWNVEGSDFIALHKAFEEQYENLFQGIDVIAERVRALDSYAVGGLQTFARMAQMDEMEAPMHANDFIAALITAHEKLVEDAIHLRDVSGELNDLQTQDLMLERLTWHEKTLWMLKATLKN